MPNAMQFLPRLSGALGFASWCNSNVIAIIGNGPLLIATCTVVESTSRPRSTHQSPRALYSDLRHGQLASPRRRRIYGTMPCRVQSRLDCSEASCQRHAPVKESQYLDVLYRSLHHVAGFTSRQCLLIIGLANRVQSCATIDKRLHDVGVQTRRCRSSCKVQSDPSCTVPPCWRHAPVVELQYLGVLCRSPHVAKSTSRHCLTID